MRVSPFDTSNRISKRYQALIGLGVRQSLTLTGPLELATYEPRSTTDVAVRHDTGFASLTLRGAYRAMLHRDGRITGVQAVGGTRDPKFDEAFVLAVTELGESKLLPAAEAPLAIFKGDSLDIRLGVAPDTMSGALGATADSTTPLMQLRLPLRRVTKVAWPKPGNPAPRFPRDLRDAGVPGKVVIEFVIDDLGDPLPSTFRFTSATAPQFAQAVLAAVPQYHFDPMRLEGCAVPVMARMPFEFSFTRP